MALDGTRTAGEVGHLGDHDALHAFYNKFDHAAVPADGQAWRWDAAQSLYVPEDDPAIPSPYVTAVKTADESVTNSATIQDDDELALAVAASSTYLLEGFLVYDSPTAADILLRFSLPSGASMGWGAAGPDPSVTAQQGAGNWQYTPNAGAIVLGGAGAAAKVAVLLRGIIVTDVTAGTVQLRWTQNTANASATTVYANSWLATRKIA